MAKFLLLLDCGPTHSAYSGSNGWPPNAIRHSFCEKEQKTMNLNELMQKSTKEIESILGEAAGRAEEFFTRMNGLDRDATAEETAALRADGELMKLCRTALQTKDHEERERVATQAAERAELIQRAIDGHGRSSKLSPLAVSAENLEILERARKDRQSVSVVENFERSAITTTLAGTATEYAANGLAAPRTLWRAAGFPTSEPPLGAKATVPLVDLPDAVALVNEGSAHAEFDDITPDAVTLKRAGAWSDLTAEVNVSTSMAELSQAHGRIIARNVDLALITKLEAAAVSIDAVDEALLTVAAEASVDVSELWIVGRPAALSLIAGNNTLTPANGGDVGSYAVAYGGARLYVSNAASAGKLTVVWPQGFRAFATSMASGVVVDPTNGTQRFGQWMLFGAGQSLVGAAASVDVSGGS